MSAVDDIGPERGGDDDIVAAEYVLGVLPADERRQAALRIDAEQAFARRLAKHGIDRVGEYMREIVDYTERLTRAALAELPDGEWSFTDWIDDDGIDFGTPIPLTVALKKRGDQMTADWTGTSPQVKGAINNTLSFTRAEIGRASCRERV